MEPARPWPDSDLLDRSRIDRDDDDLATGLTLVPGKPQISQSAAECTMPAGQEYGYERDQHKNMRPIMFQFIPSHRVVLDGRPTSARWRDQRSVLAVAIGIAIAIAIPVAATISVSVSVSVSVPVPVAITFAVTARNIAVIVAIAVAGSGRSDDG